MNIKKKAAPMPVASSDLQSLRQSISKIGRDGNLRAMDPAAKTTVTGHASLDQALGGGLARDALHEVSPQSPNDLAAATGFALGLIGRFAQERDWVWIGEEMTRHEGGRVYGPGLKNFGIDPARLLLVAPRGAEDGLKAAEDALRCAALGAVLFEPWRHPKQLDLVALRRLTLAAEESRVPLIILRHGGQNLPGSLRTRWRVAAAPSEGRETMGHPRFTLTLLLNRQKGAKSASGIWTVEWSHGERLFRPADSVDHFSASIDRSIASSDSFHSHEKSA